MTISKYLLTTAPIIPWNISHVVPNHNISTPQVLKIVRFLSLSSSFALANCRLRRGSAMNPLKISLTLSHLSSINPSLEHCEMEGALHLSMTMMPLRWVSLSQNDGHWMDSLL